MLEKVDSKSFLIVIDLQVVEAPSSSIDPFQQYLCSNSATFRVSMATPHIIMLTSYGRNSEESSEV